MKIQSTDKPFETCPEFTGRAVCVDITPPRKQQTQFGEREVFKMVFEVDLLKEDGSPYHVWTRGFTPSFNEKANLRKFLRGWLGRDLTKEELQNFDTESLIGKPAQLVVVHEHKDGQVYANIVACTPDKSGDPMKPSGKFVRAKDRKPRDSNGSGYRRVEQPASDGADLAATKIHVGKSKGLELRDLAEEQVKALNEHWLPAAKTNPKPSADDRRLITALEAWQAAQRAREDDNVPY